MKYNTLSEIFEAFNSLKVLIIGDVMVDAYDWGKVERISPEAPVPIISLSKRENRLGGAANVALNVQALGAEPILCSVIGNDLDGEDFITLLEKNKMSNLGIFKSEARPTTTKRRIMAGSQHLMRIDHETDAPLNQVDSEMLISKIENLAASCDVVIFEDYDKGTLTRDFIAMVITLAKSKNIPVAVDPKKRNFN